MWPADPATRCATWRSTPIRRITAAIAAVAVWGTGCRQAESPPLEEVGSPTLAEASAPASEPEKAVFSRADLGVERRLAPGEAHTYRFQLQAERFLHVRIDQQGSDVFTRLLDPGGALLIEVDSHSGKNEPEHLYAVTASAGRYSLVVRAFRSNSATGAYSARIVEERPPEPRDRQHAAAEKAFADAYALVSEAPARTVPESAVELYEKAVRIWHELGNSDRQAMALYELATLHDRAESKAKALTYFQRSLALLSDSKLRAIVHNQMAQIWQNTGDPDRARQGFEQALKLFRELPDSRNEAATLLNLGRLDSRQGRVRDALKRLKQAEQRWRELGDAVELSGTLNIIGELYVRLGETELALDHHRQALELSDPRTSPLERATTLSFLGQALFEAGDLAGAASAYEECLQLRRAGGASEAAKARAWTGLGVIEQRRGNPRRAVELFRHALAIFQSQERLIDRANVLSNLAWIYNDLGESEQALDLHRQALDLFASLSYPEDEAMSQLGMAFAYRRLGRATEALASAEKALAQIERVLASGQAPAIRQDLQLPYLASRQPYFDLYIDLLMEQHDLYPEAGYDALALATSEQARARNLLEILAESPVAARDEADPSLLAEQQALRDAINTADRELRRRRGSDGEAQLAVAEREQRLRWAEYYRLAQRIREESPWQASLIQPRPVALDGIRRLLDENTILLEYHLGENRSFLWAVATDWLETYPLPPRAEIERLARRTYEQLKRSDQIQHRVPAELALAQLSDVLLRPIAGRLAGQRLLVVASGALEYVPFAALKLPGPDRRWLVEEHEILNLPSASVLAALRARKPKQPPPEKLLAVFADSIFDPGDPRLAQRPQASSFDAGLAPLRRIPYSRREAEAILALAESRGPVLRALGFDSRRELAASGQLADYRILHFATHGILREDHPALSALILSRYDADGRPIEGRLSLNEIYDLEISADLVVLSACRSALGREIHGEGLMGLPRGFLYAGATQVLASLWNVQDESTAELMTRFYRHLLVEGQPAAAALRAAQRSMLEERRYAPYHWAGFIVLGDWH